MPCLFIMKSQEFFAILRDRDAPNPIIVNLSPIVISTHLLKIKLFDMQILNLSQNPDKFAPFVVNTTRITKYQVLFACLLFFQYR